MKKLLFGGTPLCLVLLMVSCSTIITSYSYNTDLSPVKTENQTNDLGSVEVYNNFLNSLDNVITRDIVEQNYPDYYGGSYTNEEGICVFLIVSGKDMDAAKKDLAKRSKSSNFVTQWCEYSYAELMAVLEYIQTKQFDPSFDTKREELKWYGLSLNEIKNRVIVRLGECTETYILKFKTKVTDSPLVDFEQGYKNIINMSPVVGI